MHEDKLAKQIEEIVNRRLEYFASFKAEREARKRRGTSQEERKIALLIKMPVYALHQNAQAGFARV